MGRAFLEPAARSRGDDLPLSRRRRGERYIAGGRVVLAGVSLLAIQLEPANEVRRVAIVVTLLGVYLVYAAVLALVAWRAWAFPAWIATASLAIDLACFSALTALTEGSTSPFFAYFVFAVISGMVRWPGRGTLRIAGAALAAYLVVGTYSALVIHDPSFELDSFLIRIIHLSVIGLLLGYLGSHHQSLQRELARLARWSRKVPRDPKALLAEALGQAGAILGAPRLALLWEEPEEPWVHFAVWEHGNLDWQRLPPGELEPWVTAKPLVGRAFFCLGGGDGAVAVYEQSGEVRQWRGRPFGLDLERRLACENAFALPLEGGSLEGLLVACDPPHLDPDLLAVGRLVARILVSQMDQLALWRSLEQSAADQERIRLTRDLHDGVLQTLAAAGLQLETVGRRLTNGSAEVRGGVARVQEILADEQRQLRQFVDRSRQLEIGPSQPGAEPGAEPGAGRFEGLAERLRNTWALEVEVRVDPELGRRLPQGLPPEAFCVLREALSNAARHARASKVVIDLAGGAGGLEIRVADDGRGFAFVGRRDLAALSARDEGPRGIRERVAALGGGLVVESTDHGAVLEIHLPHSDPKET